jgi:HTH-type transcriptional regulator, transcriptional repressor of NAD biosynthesis genes
LSRRVCLLGGESSGKTTLAFALARALGEPVVEEYGRELWEARAGQLTFGDYLHIAQRHMQLEEDAQPSSQAWVIVDTSPLTTLFYCLDQFGHADPALRARSMRTYDLSLLCEPDFPFVQDGARRDTAFRQQQHDWYAQQLRDRAMPYLRIAGSETVRLQQALALMR